MQKSLKGKDHFYFQFSSFSWTSAMETSDQLSSGLLRPMCRQTVRAEDLTRAEVLAILRMRRVLQSFGDTSEYNLLRSKCHRMLLTEEELYQIYFVRKIQQEQEQLQLARRGVGCVSPGAKIARFFGVVKM